MEDWVQRAAELLQRMAPLVCPDLAADLAEGLREAMPEDTPAAAAIKFLSAMPPSWGRPTEILVL